MVVVELFRIDDGYVTRPVLGKHFFGATINHFRGKLGKSSACFADWHYVTGSQTHDRPVNEYVNAYCTAGTNGVLFPAHQPLTRMLVGQQQE